MSQVINLICQKVTNLALCIQHQTTLPGAVIYIGVFHFQTFSGLKYNKNDLSRRLRTLLRLESTS